MYQNGYLEIVLNNDGYINRISVILILLYNPIILFFVEKC